MNARKAITILLAGLVFNLSSATNAEEAEPPQFKLDPQILLQQLFSISDNKVLLKELEIVDSQLIEISKISEDFKKKLATISLSNQQIMIQAQKEGRRVNYDEYLKPMNELSQQMEAELDKILLPHQVKRIKQIATRQQLQMQSGYSDDLSLPLTLSKQLALSAAEEQALKETVEKTRAEYEEKVQKLQNEARDKILKSLPADKRDVFQDIVGDAFDFASSRRAFREGIKSLGNTKQNPK